MRGDSLACGEEGTELRLGECAASEGGGFFKNCAIESCFFPSDCPLEARGMSLQANATWAGGGGGQVPEEKCITKTPTLMAPQASDKAGFCYRFHRRRRHSRRRCSAMQLAA